MLSSLFFYYCTLENIFKSNLSTFLITIFSPSLFLFLTTSKFDGHFLAFKKLNILYTNALVIVCRYIHLILMYGGRQPSCVPAISPFNANCSVLCAKKCKRLFFFLFGCNVYFNMLETKMRCMYFLVKCLVL